MNAYTHGNGFLNLHGYTVRTGFVPCGRRSQEDLHKHAYEYVNRNFKDRENLIKLQPAKLFLLEAADPKTIPTKDEFEEWMEKREIMKALE